jgi:transcriptional regulator with XRE-family HTH domain
MRNHQIGPLLKKYRKQNQLSVQDVVLELSDKYDVRIAEKTVYGWESNQAHPTSDVFIALCDIYKINNISEAFSDSADNKGFLITPEERTLVEHYRQNPDLQKAVRVLLGM